MNKIPRFITEYANYQKRLAKTLPNKEYTTKANERINRVIGSLERGLITIDEAINAIYHCFEQERNMEEKLYTWDNL